MKAHLKKALKFFLIVLIVVACAYILRPGFTQHSERREHLKQLESDIDRIEAERVGLEELAQKLEDEDPELIEKLAREKLHLSKPNETVFRFKETK